MKKLTKPQVKALTILEDGRRISPRRFAELMWPDSPKWKVYHKCGQSGVSRGGMMAMAGGAYLGRLSRMTPPLVRYSFQEFQRGPHYVITAEGRKALERHKANDGKG